MKVIFSRKGFDSGYGGQPSPVLPDGTMLSFPIPSPGDSVHYDSLQHDGRSFFDIIHELSPRTMVGPGYECHLDPDIRKEVLPREDGWRPAFGQIDAAESHLRNQGVGVGDLFLFFGWFRMTEWQHGKLRYTGPSSGFHAIYGYMQVGEIITERKDVPAWLRNHPHVSSDERWKRNNALYLGADTLSFIPDLPGAGPLAFSQDLTLTKKGCSRSVWDLPMFFREIPISYNANAWKEDGFHSAAKGQEFVFNADDKVLEWLTKILK